MKSIIILSLVLIVYVLGSEGFLFSKKNDTSGHTKAPKKEKCMIVKGKGKNFVGDIIHIHKDFAPTLKIIDNIAKQCDIKLSIKGSYEPVVDPSKALRFNAANVGKQLTFVIMDKTGKRLICNKICLTKEGEKVAEVKCLAINLRKQNLTYAPHGEAGTLSDGSDTKVGFTDVARRIQEACKGVKL
ncbi:unnamed protein product [Rotaria magnacalcarata]|uniref:Uncharacterized protein n=2 Tax=Rotaria TaxID=231623 RepID=A0A816GFU2_9BILA|nr:unnamed protein product [Rotaria magnacalcarata]CAF1673136.1 unnamed protein product [Rotaria magnacalcarata]CAF2085208.1 unnamed protein product [Rotaria magnacalcarata]CAF2153346.1 unnamed protein product [Rotaria magnacalcarata]CAF2222279.1 unnamed protein product [Rotaria magnacalcarata]